MNVPFNKAARLEGQMAHLEEAVMRAQLAGNGVFTERCEKLLEKSLGAPTRIVTSATHALEMMALVSGIQSGDEVILPSFTFVSTANPFVLRGARLRFADNDWRGNILPSEVERLMSKRTKAVLAVHYAGASTELDEVLAICGRQGVPLFEDAAQTIGATYRGRPLGTIGNLGCLSFHDTKNITSGEGGALIMRDDRYTATAEIIREKGTNRRQFLQGLVDKYTWVAVGSSYVLSDLNAAYLYPQLGRVDEINGRRGQIWSRYAKELGPAFARAGAQVLTTPDYNTPNFHMFAAIFSKTERRNAFIKAMKAEGVSCVFHFVPLHTSPFGSSFYGGGAPDPLPGCDHIASGIVRLPLYYNMTDAEQDYVLEKALAWLGKES